MTRAIRIFILAAVALSSAFAGAADGAKQLYEKAVTAYEKSDYLKALQFIDDSIKADPANKQAQKLKLVIESALHPADVPGAAPAANTTDDLWSYSPGQNGLDVDPEYLRVYQLADGPTEELAYATRALRFPTNAVEWETDFQMKVGDYGTVGSGVSLRSGTKVLLSLYADNGVFRLNTPSPTIFGEKVRSGWHDYKLVWRAGIVEVWIDEAKAYSTPCSGIPDLLVFGGDLGKKGRQTEAYFVFSGTSYNVPGK